MNPKFNLTLTFFVICLSISLVHVADGSNTTASYWFLSFRKLSRHEFSKLTRSYSFPPAPAPAPVPSNALHENKCGSECHDHRSLTACLQISPTDPKEAFILVKNDGNGLVKTDGNGLVKVSVMVSHSNTTLAEIDVSKDEAKKVNVSAIIGGGRSIILNAGNGDCVIEMESSMSDGNIKQFSIFASQQAPLYGAYLIFLTALISGVTWACCKSRKSRLQGKGVAYQQLEMEKPDTISAEDVETGEGWEEYWDDDWDEIKVVKSPDAPQQGNLSTNGLNSRSSD